jgi:hypothetical protein
MISLTCTPLRSIALTIFVFGTATAAAVAGAPIKWKANGSYLEVYGGDGACISSYVHVSKGGTSAAPQTWLSYRLYDVCSSEWIAYGDGPIANTAFKVTSKGATLAVMPRPTATFSTWGLLGSIGLTVTADGSYSSTSSGHSETRYPGHIVRTHGAWSSATATVTGTIITTSAEGHYASIGISRERVMELERQLN